ncbi:MAG: VWA domain-containing protein [Deltaproteobacteria bacterium]|nr:VWA domain-containing protein [Deltaproteobacteria bacterium]
MRFSRLGFVAMVIAVAALVGCGDGVEKVDWCGTDTDCPPGHYCGQSGLCAQDCTSDNECQGDDVCNEAGQCVPADDTDSGSDTGDNTDPCGDSVLLIIDRSFSMSNEGKWVPLQQELADVLATFGDGTDYGLEVFPDNSCPNNYSGTNIDTLCRPPDNMEVDIGSNTTASILDTLALLGTCGGTPTAGALVKAYDEVASYSEEVQVILVTDGAPNCNVDIEYDDCECLLDTPEQCEDHTEHCLDIAESQLAAESLDGIGAPLHVVIYAFDEGWMDAMNDLAGSGGTGAAIQCETAEDVGQAVSQILDSIINC